MPGFWAHPAPRSPKTWHICSFLPCTIGTARPNVPECGEPRDRPRPQSKTPFSRKEFITQNLALIFSIFARSLLLPTPNERRDQMCQVFGLAGPAEPENLAHLLLPSLHHSNGKAKCAGMRRTPRSAPTPVKNAPFTKRIYHSKSGPDFSIFARSLPPPYTQ